MVLRRHFGEYSRQADRLQLTKVRNIEVRNTVENS